jgi:hypothetical protein
VLQTIVKPADAIPQYGALEVRIFLALPFTQHTPSCSCSIAPRAPPRRSRPAAPCCRDCWTRLSTCTATRTSARRYGTNNQ